jgi:hypothetical protein
MNIIIGVDDTDHFTFFCPKCLNVMKVKKVNYYPEIGGDKQTSFLLDCSKCDFSGIRKIYWNYDGDFCNQITHNPSNKTKTKYFIKKRKITDIKELKWK